MAEASGAPVVASQDQSTLRSVPEGDWLSRHCVAPDRAMEKKAPSESVAQGVAIAAVPQTSEVGRGLVAPPDSNKKTLVALRDFCAPAKRPREPAGPSSGGVPKKTREDFFRLLKAIPTECQKNPNCTRGYHHSGLCSSITPQARYAQRQRQLEKKDGCTAEGRAAVRKAQGRLGPHAAGRL